MIHTRISSTSNPAVILAFQKVFVHATELLFTPGGLLGSSAGAQKGHGEQCLDVTNCVTGITGRSLTPVMRVGSTSRQVLGGNGEQQRGLVSRIGLALWRSAWLGKKGTKLA